ncbi:uncharacterized protein BJ171DRAFT_594592 [Polychytrium aggregatum]|uniref:uncharacterized protein n=1 Tax=Polychytrium aggregatum TaxID=110093 RepID=UPI0022FE5AF6|nr:uncharacterized protein BJ171DRAFT_594592 [Polychytrium aggregatum]KAI9209547.1 hypothetical protein BJ171DRAFT_594592 [Polychytrium aggregatum]
MSHYVIGLDLTDASSFTFTWAYRHLLSDGDTATIITVLPGWTEGTTKVSELTPEMSAAESLAQERANNLLLEMEKTEKRQIETYFRVVHADQDPRVALCNAAVNLKASTLVLGYDQKKSSHDFGAYCLDHCQVPVVVVRPTLL